MESMEGSRFFPVVEDAYFRLVAYMYKIMWGLRMEWVYLDSIGI